VRVMGVHVVAVRVSPFVDRGIRVVGGDADPTKNTGS
jgi:hypothetical protein